jgi:hypothetical protein
MSQQSSTGNHNPGKPPSPQAGAAAQVARRNDPFQMGPAMPTENWKKMPNDNDPATKQAMQALFKSKFLEPGMGLGTPVSDPQTGLRRERQRRMAQGASARERMKIFQEAGVTDRAGMARVFDRAYTTPERAFMLGKRR